MPAMTGIPASPGAKRQFASAGPRCRSDQRTGPVDCINACIRPGGMLRRESQSPDCQTTPARIGPALANCRFEPGLAGIPVIAGILDEAIALCELDLLISVDTLSAHLAGALGVRTWTLLPFESDWRRMARRDDSPWYPTMRLFRQRRPADWEEVIERVASSLQKFKNTPQC